MQSALHFEGAWSQGTSTRSKWVNSDQAHYPAPGTYTLNFKNKKNIDQKKFDKAERQNLADPKAHLYPGPGTYEGNQKPGDQSYKYNKIKFGEKYKISSDNHFPSPATYHPKFQTTKNIKPTYSMSYKHPKEIVSTTPAPNRYPDEENDAFLKTRTQEKWLRKTTYSGFGTSPQRGVSHPQKRLDYIKKKKAVEPGPGEYLGHDNFSSTQGQGWSIGRSERVGFGGDGMMPGPNHFDPKLQHNKTGGFSMGLKLNQGMKMYETCSPGPGNYNPAEVKSRQNIKIGTGQSHGGIIDEKTAFLNPGPGQYEQQQQQKQTSYLKSTSIGLADRPDLDQAASQNVPGPGTYFSEEDQKLNGPAYGMAGRFKERKKYNSVTPSPAQYQQIVDSTSPMFSVGKGQRSKAARNAYVNVAPNSYQASNTEKQVKGYKYSIGTSSRFKQQKKTYEPGPGSYDLGSTIGKIPEYLLLSKKKNTGLLDF